MNGEAVGGRWRKQIVTVIVFVAVSLSIGWALRTVLAPAPDVLNAPSYTLVAARHGSVEQSVRLNTSARWEPIRTALNQAAGIVTTVEHNGAILAKPGTMLYTVGLRPVVVAEGKVPAFRDLALGVHGDDVKQLQHMLSALDIYSGDADGVFDSGVRNAVRAWQRGLGVARDGVVRMGDIVYLPGLPARLALDLGRITVGAALSGGEPAVQVLPEEPRFTIALPEQQARMVAPGMAVEIEHSASTWRAEVAQVLREDEGYVALLAPAAEDAICGKRCDVIPLGDPTLLPSTVRIVAPVSGITIPAVAIVTKADGTVGVLLADGAFRTVRVTASANGISVVEGIDDGALVRAPGGVP